MLDEEYLLMKEVMNIVKKMMEQDHIFPDLIKASSDSLMKMEISISNYPTEVDNTSTALTLAEQSSSTVTETSTLQIQTSPETISQVPTREKPSMLIPKASSIELILSVDKPPISTDLIKEE